MKIINAGKIINTHGIKGELKVKTNFSDLFMSNTDLIIKSANLEYQETIQNVRMHKGFVLIKLVGYENINDVLHFKNSTVFLETSEEIVVLSDLINYEVYEGSELIGVVKEVLSNSHQDVLLLSNSIMIPNVEAFVKDINHDEKIIAVSLIEGMRNHGN